MNQAEIIVHPYVKDVIKSGIPWPRKELSKSPKGKSVSATVRTWFKNRPKAYQGPRMAYRKRKIQS